MRRLLTILMFAGALLAFGEASVELPPDWEVLSGAQYNMSLYAQVLDENGLLVESRGSALGVFDASGQCRGVAQIEEGPCGLWYQVTVVANSATESGFSMKVLNASEGEVHDLKETFDFVSDSTLPVEDYAVEPWTLHCKPLTADLVISLVQNWNWISFNVQQGDRSILEFLEDYTKNATDGDIIKSQNGQATFSKGKWYPSPATFKLEPGRMYKLRKQSTGSCTLTVNGAPTTGEEAIPVVAGWNWIGYTGESTAAIGAIYKEGGFSTNDLLKPQSGSQATFSNGKWYGSLVLTPSLGYMLKQSAAGVVDFRNAKENETK